MRTAFARRPIALLVALLLISYSSVGAQHDHRSDAASKSRLRLGTVHMPNSGAPAAQAAFRDGLAALHSFEYGLAARAFRDAQRLDANFALAYWGEAMTHTHPVWNQQAADSARGVLARYAHTREARRARAPTAREADWLDAVEVLYGAGGKAQRDTLYLHAMEKLAETYPDDMEAQAFLALAWLGLNQSIRATADYMRAGAIAARVMQRHPDHPGAAHYVIHAFDDPPHAPLGLDAARAYSRIAPDAPHAQHMTTHIFLALGMWEETVAQNVSAVGSQPWVAGHYTSWWHYALTQLGREHEATALRDSMRRSAKGVQTLSQLRIEAHHAVEFDRWDDSVFSAPVPAMRPDMRLWWHGMQGIAAARRGDRATSERHVREFEALLKSPALEPLNAPYRSATHNTLLASRAFAANDHAEAVRYARLAVALSDTLPADFGPPVFTMPPQELLAELLLASGQAAESQRAWQRALQLGPGRSRAFAGLARAARAAGDHVVADAALAQLERNWHRADPVPALLAELRRVAARP